MKLTVQIKSQALKDAIFKNELKIALSYNPTADIVPKFYLRTDNIPRICNLFASKMCKKSRYICNFCCRIYETKDSLMVG